MNAILSARNTMARSTPTARGTLGHVPPSAPDTPGMLSSDERRRRLSRIARVSAAICIGIPTLGAILYYGFIAADQFETEIHFSIRMSDLRPDRIAFAMESGKSTSPEKGDKSEKSDLPEKSPLPDRPSIPEPIVDPRVLVDYLRSAELVREVDREIDLRSIYSTKGDALSRFNAAKPLERLTRYWGHMVASRVDATSGIVIVDVSAFTPDDALKIANEVLEKSAALVNRVAATSRLQSVQHAEEDVRRGENRLRLARAEMRKLRGEARILDSHKAASGQEDLGTRLSFEVSRLSAEYNSGSARLSPDAPTVRVVRDQLDAARTLLAAIHSEGVSALPVALETFENLQSNVQFAEKSYESALRSLERARMMLVAKTQYLAIHVPPRRAEETTKPRRILMMFAVFGSAAAFWGIGWLTFLGVRDHEH